MITVSVYSCRFVDRLCGCDIKRSTNSHERTRRKNEGKPGEGYSEGSGYGGTYAHY
jgi:hypothetical protein